MAYGTKAAFEPIRELAFGSISGTYAQVGTSITDHARLIRIVNQTDAQLYLSFNGVDNQIRMATNSFFIIDLTTNKVRDDGLFFRVGSQFYVKEVSSSPSSGSCWIEVLYAGGGV